MNWSNISIWSNNHQGLVAIAGIVIAAVIAVLTWISSKNSNVDKSKNKTINTAGRDMITGNNNQIINSSTKENITLDKFERYIEEAEWSKEFIEHNEIWVCIEDNLFQIVVGNETQPFETEEWTKVYPDSAGSGRYEVDLKYAQTIIKRITFIFCDGHSINVPMPEIEMNGDKRVFYWRKNSLEFKLGKLIGRFYIYNSMEGVAKMSRIEIK